MCAAFRNKGSRIPELTKIVKNIYQKLFSLNATISVYWISTVIMLADPESRSVDLNEEFIPQSYFEIIQKWANTKIHVDLFASEANTKTEYFYSLYPNKNPNCLGIDFFDVNPEDLKSLTLFAFPPKNILHKTLVHIKNHFMRHKMVILLKAFEHFPASLACMASHENIQIFVLPDFLTLVPAEKVCWVNGIRLFAKKNTWAKANLIVFLNIEVDNQIPYFDPPTFVNPSGCSR